MKPGNIIKNNNAVSISIGFILMFTVTIIMFSIIVISFYNITEEMKQDAVRESYRMLGNRFSIELTIVDTMLNITESYGGRMNSLEYEFTAPASIAGESYSFNITNATNEIIIESDDVVTVTPFNISSKLNGRKLYSGVENYRFTYNDAADKTINIEEI